MIEHKPFIDDRTSDKEIEGVAQVRQEAANQMDFEDTRRVGGLATRPSSGYNPVV